MRIFNSLVFIVIASIALLAVFGLVSAEANNGLNERSNITVVGSDSNNTIVNSGSNGTIGAGSNNTIVDSGVNATVVSVNGNSNISEGRRETIRNEVRGINERIRDMKEERREKIEDFKNNMREKRDAWIDVEGSNITVKSLTEEQKEIIAEKINAKTNLNLSAEDIDNKTMLRAYLSNGRWAFVKEMPNRASETALKRMGAKCEERNCSIELKEVGEGNKTRLAYEVRAEKDSRVLLIFRKKMSVMAQVDAESGEVISLKKPWWGFMARESQN